MKKIFILSVAALAMCFSACSDNQADEQMSAIMMNKCGKAEKAKYPFARGNDKNAKNNVMPIANLIRRPLGDTYYEYNEPTDMKTGKIKK